MQEVGADQGDDALGMLHGQPDVLAVLVVLIWRILNYKIEIVWQIGRQEIPLYHRQRPSLVPAHNVAGPLRVDLAGRDLRTRVEKRIHERAPTARRLQHSHA